jgi:hypothetical protein
MPTTNTLTVEEIIYKLQTFGKKMPVIMEVEEKVCLIKDIDFVDYSIVMFCEIDE